jgi:leucyl aminopeptidase
VPAVQALASTESPLATGADAVAFGLFEGETVTDQAAADLLQRGEASAQLGRVAQTHAEGKRVLVIGLGRRAEFGGEEARVAAAHAHRRARETGGGTLCWALPRDTGPLIAGALVTGTALAAYRFTRFKPAPAGETPVTRLIVSADEDVSGAVRAAAVLAEAQNRARELGNLPPNELTPTALAEYAAELAARHPTLEISVLGGDEIRARGMGAFAAVSQGSVEDPRLIELRYENAGPEVPLLGLIGKAITFDSGGLTIKGPTRIMEMKFDMGGGAAVIEAIGALAELGLPGRVLGVIGASENMPGPRAMKPGDIVTALDGTTIEIDNPDAEGRMVLGDCITHARRAGCTTLVDIATLTGAVESALGFVYAGVMSSDDGLAERIVRAGESTGELVWRLPLHPRYAELTKGRYAVLTNRPEPRLALASSAAEFIHHFAGDVPWAHLDMAGVGYNGRRPYLDKGGTGWGVRLLTELVGELAA